MTRSNRYRAWYAGRVLMAFAALLVGIESADAEETAAYRAKLEPAAAHLRVAWSYARTGNADLAGLEAEAFIAAWNDLDAVASALEAGNGSQMVADVRRMAKSALAHIDAGALTEARDKLAEARGRIRAFHRTAGIETFADCIWDANRTGDALWVHIRQAPNLKDEATAREVAGAASAYSNALQACNVSAPPEIAREVEFRRLMDTTLTSLGIAQDAARAGDGGLLHRYLIEIISIDRLLFFRFG